MKSVFTYFLLAFIITLPCFAQEEGSEVPKVNREPIQFEKTFSGTFNGQNIEYKSVMGETFLRNSKGEVTAGLWSTSYIRTGVESSKRPVTFIFNGGPGSASVWLHMGFFGPKVVKTDSDAKIDDGAAPYTFVDNPQALLDITDLVFIDPIGTGFSQVEGVGKNEDFWGLNEDARSIAQFMRIWVTKHGRWQAPKFIAGESFGTTRAAKIAEVLEGGGQTMALNGIILISQALDYAGSSSWADNLTSFFTYLPSMAATAWYHNKAGEGKELEDFVAEAREFAYGDYLTALYKGELQTAAEKSTIADKLAYFTGLDKDYILRSDNQILMHRFKKELLREEGKAIGTLDGRYLATETDQSSEGPVLGDPSSYMTGAAYTAVWNDYLRSELGVEMDRPYYSSAVGMGGNWNWKPVPDGSYWEPSYVSTARSLSEAMHRNTAMQVLVANGYYDLITPFFDAEYTFARHDFPQDRIQMTYYEAGHMMYNHQEDFDALAKDIREFISKLIP
ncbi:S10 family peptidase [Algoriphagus machipongonensis]|uniref:Serine carboxypeptidase family protein n=1 Tax=Algoriphagus machipongonensis TaxID=388413 RepID=A3HVI1_9BACT|nr:septum formation initiator [Algoriphagus machipongonensis]EAZ82153.1 serine carboxypeptidase family protein [Algoriphagus machipongonensis]